MEVDLVPLTPNDFQRLIDWADSPEALMQWTGPKFKYPLTLAQLEDHIRGVQGASPERVVFKALEIQSGQVVGMWSWRDSVANEGQGSPHAC